jgi:hypothetical protein
MEANFLTRESLNEKGAYANLQANEIVLWRKSYSKVHVTSGLHQEAGTKIPKIRSASIAHELSGYISNSDMDLDSEDSLAPFFSTYLK